jgi:hypothetical protein
MSKIFGIHTPAEIKNYIINGNFDFFQRGTSFSGSGVNVYLMDRWYGSNSGSGGSTWTITQQSSSAPTGSAFYMQIAWNNNAAYKNIATALESGSVNLLKGKNVTVSCLVKKNASITANEYVQLNLDKNSTADTSSGGTWVNISSASILGSAMSTSSWTKVSFTAFVPDDGTANGLRVGLAMDSQASVAGGALQIAQVMLTEGTLLCPFQRAGKDLSQEFQMCQRYYEIGGDIGISTTNNPSVDVWGGMRNDRNNILGCAFKVSKRALPSVTLYYDNSNGGLLSASPGSVTVDGFGATSLSITAFMDMHGFIANSEL